jgi:hypothetical protein
MYVVYINNEKVATFSDKMGARRYARLNAGINGNAIVKSI